MVKGKSNQSDKGLKRADSFIKHFHKSIKYVSKWSNNPIQATKQLKLTSIFLMSFLNIRMSDLKNCPLKEFSAHSCRLYLTILLTLYIEGKAARTKILKCTGIGGDKINLIKELEKHHYIEEVLTPRIQYTYLGQGKKILQKEIQLTSKGYDFLNQIFKLMINEELL